MIALDLSRLLSRAGFATPTGIDRVELAYARHLLAGGGEYCFAAINAVGAIGLLAQAGTARFTEVLESVWRDGPAAGQALEIKTLVRQLRRDALLGGARALQTRLRADATPVYLLVSHEISVVFREFRGCVSGFPMIACRRPTAVLWAARQLTYDPVTASHPAVQK
jgi:hypothetical protein